jgi:hypothetical protein
MVKFLINLTTYGIIAARSLLVISAACLALGRYGGSYTFTLTFSWQELSKCIICFPYIYRTQYQLIVERLSYKWGKIALQLCHAILVFDYSDYSCFQIERPIAFFIEIFLRVSHLLRDIRIEPLVILVTYSDGAAHSKTEAVFCRQIIAYS